MDKKLSQFLLNDRKVLRFKAGYSAKFSSEPVVAGSNQRSMGIYPLQNEYMLWQLDMIQI